MKGTTLDKRSTFKWVFPWEAFPGQQGTGQIELKKKTRVLMVRGVSLRLPECLEIEYNTPYIKEPQRESPKICV